MPRIFNAPGVYREEIDLSEILVPAGISNGGMVIRSIQGPINRPVLVRNDKEFVETFGQPYFVSGITSSEASTIGITASNNYGLVPEYGYGSYAALEFLKESQNLFIIRGYTNGTDQYANANIHDNLNVSAYDASAISAASVSALTYGNPDRVDRIYSIEHADMDGANLLVAALYPGEQGDNIAVTVEAFNSACDWINNYDTYSPSPDSSAHPIAAKVFKMNVYQKNVASKWTDFIDPTISGVSGLRITPVETFYGTLNQQLDSNNNQLFIKTVVNGISKFVYVNARGTVFTPLTATSARPVVTDTIGDLVYLNKLIQLSNGKYTQSTGIKQDGGAWSLFQDRELVNVGILICTDWNANVKQSVSNVVASRLDCIASLQVDAFENNTADAIMKTESYGYVDPSYIALYAGWSKIYDNYNNKYVYVPNSIYGGSLMARVDAIANPWDAPAGIDRATLSVFDQMKVFNMTDIGNLYNMNINAVRFIRGTGYVMWGQKTAQLKKSALDRINVRRMLLYVENNIETALLPFVFENNTDKTRLRVFSLVDEFMAGVKSGGGVTAYQVVCDETNNTPQVIDSNQLAVDLYVQPARTAEFIKFTTVVTRTGISFSTVRIA
jgi:hypothetical protein